MATSINSSYNPNGSALFSADRVYRYYLARNLLPMTGHLGVCSFILLNGSKADSRRNDNTVSRCVKFARLWGYQRIEVLNIFGLMSTDPKALTEHHDPVGPDNDYWLKRCIDEHRRWQQEFPPPTGFYRRLVIGWGGWGGLHERGAQVEGWIEQAGLVYYCWGRCQPDKNGRAEPKHPSRLGYATELIRCE